MLLTKEVEVLPVGVMKQRLINLGYEYVGKFIPITVKTEHLTHGSKAIVKYRCEKCGCEKELMYSAYAKKKRDWCETCSKRSSETKTRKTQEEIAKPFIEKGYTIIGDVKNTNKPIKYICQNHPDKVQRIRYYDIATGHGCVYCARKRIDNSGENHPNWKGGVTSLNIYLRNLTKDWRTEQFYRTHYICELSKKHTRKLEVHHLISFGSIVNSVINQLNVEVKQVSEYSPEELAILADLFVEQHNKLARPMVLDRKIHHLFHLLYGKYNNTLEQFEEFSDRYRAGEFIELIG